MILLFLTLFSFSRSEIENHIVSLTDKSFERLVKSRPGNEVWFVMFVQKDNDPEHRDSYNRFKNASDLACGMVKYGTVNIDRYPNLKEEFNISTLPAFRIFHPDGDVNYEGDVNVKSFMVTTMKYLKDVSFPIAKEWSNEMINRPAAMLFARENKKPFGVWTGISAYYQRKPIRIGFTNNLEIAEYYNITALPSIIFSNGIETTTYEGSHSFRSIRDAIEVFFARKLSNDDPAANVAVGDIMTPDEFSTHCYGGTDLCVIAVTAKIPDSMILLQSKMTPKKKKIKWFAGTKGIPDSFMEKKGGIWVYNPRRDGFMHCEDEELLSEAIDRVLDGSAKWTKRSQLIEENKEL